MSPGCVFGPVVINAELNATLSICVLDETQSDSSFDESLEGVAESRIW